MFAVNSAKNIRLINEMLDIRKQYIKKINNKDELEELNMTFPTNKAVSFTITMSIKDWHKTFIGRFSENGVEKDLRNVCSLILKKLRVNYSFILKKEKE